MKSVFFEGKQVEIDNLPEGFYLIKLRQHSSYVGPRIERKEIIDFIDRRNWQELDVEVLQANLRYASLYKPKTTEIIEEN